MAIKIDNYNKKKNLIMKNYTFSYSIFIHLCIFLTKHVLFL